MHIDQDQHGTKTVHVTSKHRHNHLMNDEIAAAETCLLQDDLIQRVLAVQPHQRYLTQHLVWRVLEQRTSNQKVETLAGEKTHNSKLKMN